MRALIQRVTHAAVEVDGRDVVPDVHEVLDAMYAFADRVRSGEWVGVTGKRITQEALTRGLRADGLGTLLGGIFNTLSGTALSMPIRTSRIAQRYDIKWVQ